MMHFQIQMYNIELCQKLSVLIIEIQQGCYLSCPNGGKKIKSDYE